MIGTVALCTLILAVGVWCLRRGMRGARIDGHWICRKCGYDLSGLPTQSLMCPECGADLRARRAVAIGHRRRSPRIILSGLVLILGTSLFVGQEVYTSVSGITPIQFAPASLLLRLNSDSATRELVRRLRIDSLSESERNVLVDRLLARQGSGNALWDGDWGDAIQAAQRRGEIPPDRWNKYISQGIVFQLLPRPKVREGAPLPVRLIAVSTRFGHGVAYRTRLLNISGIVHPLTYGMAWSMMSSAMGIKGGGDGDAVIPPDVFAKLEPGPQSVNATIEVVPLGPDRNTTPIGPAIVTARAVWQLVPANCSTIEEVCPADEVDAMRRAVSISNMNLGRHGGFISVALDNPPEAFAFDVFVRSGKAEWRVNQVSGVAGVRIGTSASTAPSGWDLEPGVKTVDVILRPSVSLAERQTDLTKIWGQDMVFANQPTKQ